MDLHEAYRVLGISETDTPATRKRKYRRLMMLYHPDSTGENNIHISQRINAAYEYLKSHENEISVYDSASGWDAEINENAFCERAVYVDPSGGGGQIFMGSLSGGVFNACAKRGSKNGGSNS